ncbi:MAG: hypothetical protein Q8N94_03895 [Methanoregula sp.]|nr:hypothetical protein [Methanoregula sp.]
MLTWKRDADRGDDRFATVKHLDLDLPLVRSCPALPGMMSRVPEPDPADTKCLPGDECRPLINIERDMPPGFKNIQRL